jgi:hypothetical protein
MARSEAPRWGPHSHGLGRKTARTLDFSSIPKGIAASHTLHLLPREEPAWLTEVREAAIGERLAAFDERGMARPLRRVGRG